MIKRQNFHLYLGRDVTLDIYLDSDTPNLDGAIISWYLGTTEEATGSDIKITRKNTSGTIDPPVLQSDGRWLVSIPLPKAVSASLPEQTYYHLLDIEFPNGKTYPACKGEVTSEKMMTGA